MDKKSARFFGLQQRLKISSYDRHIKDQVIFEKVTSFLHLYQKIALFVSFGNEVNTHLIIEWCFSHNKDVFVPKTEKETLVFYQIHSFEDLKIGNWGILEPYHGRKIRLSEVEIMFVPLSSFDIVYHRTGYGKGYYDSILNQVKYKVGLAYQAQQTIDIIEVDPWDITLDKVITEQ